MTPATARMAGLRGADTLYGIEMIASVPSNPWSEPPCP
jgi:hypothetical protein